MNIPYLKPILAGVALAIWAGSIWYARSDAKQEVYAEWHIEDGKRAEAARQAAESKRIKDQERIDIAERVAKDAQEELKRQAPKLAKYDDSVKRLRTAEVALRAALAGRTDSTTSERSTVSASADDLLANMQRRMDQAQREHIVYTDRLKVGHEACIRQYNEVRNTQQRDAGVK